ncbi:MAG: FHA domain-containing protein [Bilifractor sp.]
MINSEELLDTKALAFINGQGSDFGLFPCFWIHYNERIKLAFFPDAYKTLEQVSQDMDLNEVTKTAQALLARVIALAEHEEISLENVIWDTDSIYLDDKGNVYLICLPATIPEESKQSGIYIKRIYAMIEDLVSDREGGAFVCRQISYQKQKNFGDWNSLSTALEQRSPAEIDNNTLTLKSINTPRPLIFVIRQEKFRIGTDPGEADGLITDVDTVSPVHAIIGWNGINYYVSDQNSENGTYINDQRIAPNTEIPIGEGTVIRFADCTFNVE